MKKDHLSVVVVLLALLMWYSNTDLFLRLEELNGRTGIGITILNTVLALGYSTLSAISVRHLEDYKFVKFFAIFDGVAVFLHFQSNIPPALLGWIGAVYYALLMFFIVSMIWKLSDIIRKRDSEAEAKKIEATEIKKVENVTSEPQNPTQVEQIVEEAIPAAEDFKYPDLKSLNGAISRSKNKTAEELIMMASPIARAEYISKHPEITITIS